MKTNYDLTPFDLQILRVLPDNGSGYITNVISMRLCLSRCEGGPRLRKQILHLQALGLVATLDDLKPACWVITAKGKAAVRGAEVRA